MNIKVTLNHHKEKILFIFALLFILSIGIAVQFRNHSKFEQYVTSANIDKKQFEISRNLIVLINQIDRNLMPTEKLTFDTGNSDLREDDEQLKQRLLDTRAKAVSVMQYLQKHEHHLTPETLFEANNMLESIKNDYNDIKELLDKRLKHLDKS